LLIQHIIKRPDTQEMSMPSSSQRALLQPRQPGAERKNDGCGWTPASSGCYNSSASRGISCIHQEGEDTMTVAETFETMQSIFNPAAAAGMNKTIQWNISGDEAGKWAFKIADQKCELIPGGVEKPDLTMSMSDKDWLAIAEGKLDPMNAFMTGKVKTAGDVMLAMRIANIFPVKR
jgi:putative sterol carrier protein